ncbi:Uncharacterized protein APZ42_001136 [Daphnia magna]|uniref:Uncharacterized protein n=1 Tax=Daphnia magna TaxID=35525 RepID=A0A164J5L7_9CRUS|nr:Uncharacterized protein APZ42_001136 [Daphnia magna]
MKSGFVMYNMLLDNKPCLSTANPSTTNFVPERSVEVQKVYKTNPGMRESHGL